MEINLGWNVTPSSFPRQATRDGEDKAPTHTKKYMIPPPKRPRLQREAGGSCECFLKVLGSLLPLGPSREVNTAGISRKVGWPG